MSKSRFSARNMIAGLALIALLAVLFTLGVFAQDPNNGQAVNVPEKITVVEEVELLPGASGPNQSTFYKRYSADVFMGLYDDWNYSSDGAGCVHRMSGTSWTVHTLQLPEGAEITYLRLYFFDMDADHEAGASLYAFDGQGNQTVIDTVESSGTPGWSSVGSGLFSYIVHNTDEALEVRLDYDVSTNSTLQICGVRVQYQYTLSRTNLPLILNESNP